jgi:DNA-binding transcriptional MerR regulator
MRDAIVPEKLFFKIGEVAAIAALRPSVLRFWETEFSFLHPQKSKSGQRLYSRKELDLVLEIKRLLYTEKLTIEGAKRRISRREHKIESREEVVDPVANVQALLLEIKHELQQISDYLC